MNLFFLSNPYRGSGFSDFFIIFIQRLFLFLSGNLPIEKIAHDEWQIISLCAVGICCGLTGTLLILRKLSMMANSISHTSLLGIVICYIMYSSFLEGDHFNPFDLSPMLILSSALVTAILTTFCIQWLIRTTDLGADVSNGLIFTGFFALGIVLMSWFSHNAHIGVELVTGSIEFLHPQDLKMLFWCVGITCTLIALFFKEFQFTSFDSRLAKTLGFYPNAFEYLLMLMTSLTIVCSFRIVGIILVLAFLVIPPLTARLLSHSLKKMLWYSCGISCLGSYIGVALARDILSRYKVPLSTSGLVVLILTALYVCTLFFQRIYFAKRNIK